MQVPTRVLAEHQGLNRWHLHAAAEETAWSKLETVHLSSGFSTFSPVSSSWGGLAGSRWSDTWSRWWGWGLYGRFAPFSCYPHMEWNLPCTWWVSLCISYWVKLRRVKVSKNKLFSKDGINRPQMRRWLERGPIFNPGCSWIVPFSHDWGQAILGLVQGGN